MLKYYEISLKSVIILHPVFSNTDPFDRRRLTNLWWCHWCLAYLCILSALESTVYLCPTLGHGGGLLLKRKWVPLNRKRHCCGKTTEVVSEN